MHWLVPDDVWSKPEQVEFGVVLGHGYATETPAQLGIGAAAAAAIAQEIARPREISGHRVEQAAVAVEVGLQHTVWMLSGEPETVGLAARSLGALLREPGLLEPAGPARLPYGWNGWTDELSAWLGMGPGPLAGEITDPWVGPPEELHRFVESLDPGRGRRTVAWTTEPGLVGVIAGRPESPVDQPALTWREPSPTTDGPAAIVPTFDDNLLTSRTPTGWAGDLALRVLVRTLHRTLVRMTGLVAGVQVVVEPIGLHTLLAVRAVAHERSFDVAAVQQNVQEALAACAALDDRVLEQELEQALTPESLDRDLGLGGRAVDALRTGARPTTAELVAGLEAVTVPDLRQALSSVLGAVLVGRPAAAGAQPGLPLVQPPPLPPVGRGSLRRRAMVPRTRPSGPVRQRLQVIPTVLQQTLTPVNSFGYSAGRPQPSAVDLTAVVARVDQGSDWSTLIDRENRRLTLTWPTYHRVEPLRALVDAATGPATRRAATVDPAAVAELSRRFRRRRLDLGLQAVGYALFLLLLVWHPTSGSSRQQAVVAHAAAGQVVTLANGSTLQVAEATWKRDDQATYVLTARVRQCGGAKTVDRDADEDERNWVELSRYTVTGVSQPTEQVVPLSAGQVPLQSTLLPAGQCTAGLIAFFVYTPSRPTGAGIRYANDAHDDVTWALR